MRLLRIFRTCFDFYARFAYTPAVLEPYKSPLQSSTTEVRPSRTRLLVLAFLCTLALLLYIDRVCIGQAQTAISAELGISKEQMALVFNAFTAAYCLFEVPAGHWGDRYGSRGIITRIVIWWSLFTALTGATFGLWQLVLVRFLFGAGEAGAFPNVARVITRWFPLNERGRVRGIITTVSLIGGALAPILASQLIYFVGWRWTFAIFGALGVFWAVLFYLWFRDDPANHSQVNEQELKIIRAQQTLADTTPAHAPIPWAYVLLSPNVWLMGGIMTSSSILFYVQFQWYPTYLKETHHVSERMSGLFTGVMMLGGAIGCTTGGWFVDFINRRTRERRWVRSLCGAVPLLLAGLSIWAVRYTTTPVQATVCQALALFFVQIAIPTWWTVVAEISGSHGAAMWGLMNSLGGVGQIVATQVIGSYLSIQNRNNIAAVTAWRPVFDGVAIALCVGATFWLLVKATQSIVGDDKI